MKTLFMYHFVDSVPQFFEMVGDYSHLDCVYLNAPDPEDPLAHDKERELRSIAKGLMR